MKVVLYSTTSCSLCEQAIDLLLSMPEMRGCALEVVDVAAVDALVERFGERIPVLAAAGGTLDWPFDAAAVRQLLGAASPAAAGSGVNQV